MIKNVLFLLMLCALSLVGCKGDDDMLSLCGDEIIINKSQFNNRDTTLSISNMSIIDNCLSITIGYSGCDNGHAIDLVSSGDVAESLPVQIGVGLKDNNPELCLAFFTETYQFDLTPFVDLLPAEASARLIFSDQGQEILWTIQR